MGMSMGVGVLRVVVMRMTMRVVARGGGIIEYALGANAGVRVAAAHLAGSGKTNSASFEMIHVHSASSGNDRASV